VILNPIISSGKMNFIPSESQIALIGRKNLCLFAKFWEESRNKDSIKCPKLSLQKK
jgi:hypothetical protein